MDVIMGVAVVIVVAAAIAFVMFRHKAKVAERAEQIKELEHLLDRVSEAATRRKTQLYESMENTENAALISLKEMVVTAPVDISEEIDQIEARWSRLSRQLAEFSQQSVQSTLQSSVVTTRAAMTADDITEIVKAAKTKLARLS